MSEHLLPAARVGPTLRDEYERPASDLLVAAPEVQGVPLAGLLGVPFDTTTLLRRGSRFGCGAVRQAFANCLTYDPNWGVDLSEAPRVADFGDVDVLQTDVGESWRRITEAAGSLAGRGFPLIVVGGDHGVTFPVLRGVGRASGGRLGVINVDAHFDVRISQHGEVSSGVPFRYVLEQLRDTVDGRNFVELGAGGWRNTRLYHDYLEERGSTVITARQLHRGDFDALVQEAFEIAADGTDGIWLSIDVDAIDSAFMPGTATPAVAGLTSMQILEIAWAFGRRDDVVGMDVMEVSPPYDPAGSSQQLAAHVLLTFLAGRHGA